MATEKSRVRSLPAASDLIRKVTGEHANHLRHELDTTQTDSAPLPARDGKAPATSESPGESKSAAEEAKTCAAHLTESTLGFAAVTSAPAPSEAKKDEPQTGEKRDLDSASAVPAEDNAGKERSDEKTQEPDVKKQKSEGEPSKNTNGTSAHTATSGANGKPTKTGRSKKDKAKDAIKRAIPTDGIGSRTRSRTKGT